MTDTCVLLTYHHLGPRAFSSFLTFYYLSGDVNERVTSVCSDDINVVQLC